MLEELLRIIFGWPSALSGAVLLSLGVSFKRTWLTAVGAVLSAGFCAYVGLNPFPFRVLGPGVLAANGLAAVVLRKEGRLVSATLLLPYSLLLIYFAGALRHAW